MLICKSCSKPVARRFRGPRPTASTASAATAARTSTDGSATTTAHANATRAEIAPGAACASSATGTSMQVPRVEKITVNIGLGEARENARAVETATADIATITGQKPRRHEGEEGHRELQDPREHAVGVAVTLRGARMYEFLDRLLNAALPRIRDFHGVLDEGVRRPRQLQPGRARAADLPGDRLRQGGPDPRHADQHRHDGQERRRRPPAAGDDGHAVLEGARVAWRRRRMIVQGEPRAEVLDAQEEPLQACAGGRARTSGSSGCAGSASGNTR